MSQSLEQKQKEAIGRRQFNISPSEKLIDHLSCKYKSKISAGGALWIFKWHVCYYSNLFGAETKIRIRISEISRISPSGNSSMEIITTKTKDTHKFVGFPSKERRDTVIQFITKQQIQHQTKITAAQQNSLSTSSLHSPSTHSLNVNTEHIMNRTKSNSMHRPHSHSLEDITQQKSEDISFKTAIIHPKPQLQPLPPSQPAPSKPLVLANNNMAMDSATHGNNKLTVSNGHGQHENNASDMVTHNQEHMSKMKANHNTKAMSPARFITSKQGNNKKTLQLQLQPSQQQVVNKRRKRRKSSGGINYNNPPTFRLQSIYSQHSLQLITPQVNSDESDGDEKIAKLKRQLSNKDSGGIDTLDMFNLERSLSIHSDDTHQNRCRSWSDSDMPYHDDDEEEETQSSKHVHKDNKTRSPFAGGGWLSIFHAKVKSPLHTKQNKKKVVHNASSSLGTIPKQALPKTSRTRSVQSHERNTPKATDITKAQSLPISEENKEDDHENNENMPTSLTQYIDESYALTPIHLGSFQNLEWKPLYMDDFWTKPALLFHEAFSDVFIKKMHTTRKSVGLKIGEWNMDDDEKSVDNQPMTYVRKMEYISKIKDPPPFMPSKTEVYETQRFRFYGSNRVVVDAVISTPNIKYGDYFLICQRYIFTVNEQDDNKTHMECSISFQWVKKTWFEKIITSKATSEAEQGMAMWSGKLHEIFPPKISKQEILTKQISNKNILPSPKRRVIDKRVIDYFHTPRKRKDVIIKDWIKPCVELFIDIIKAIFRPSSWTNLYNILVHINDVEQHDNLFTIKHGLLGLAVMVLLFIMCNIGWMIMWYWYSSSLNNIIREQNQILQQQTQVFEQLLLFLNKE